MEKNIVVIGGSNIDICAKTCGKVSLKDSNTGHVEFGLGGVGRNVAEEICLFGADVSLITAVGRDSFGRVVSDRSDEIGLKMLAEPFSDVKTGVFSYVSDNEGMFVVGVNDMEITEKITPEVIDENINIIRFSDYVVIDANLSKETIDKVASLDVKLIADSVSRIKCKRLSDVLDKLFILKCNKAEACELTGAENYTDAVKLMADKGLKRGIITLGGEGSMCFEVRKDGIHTYRMANFYDSTVVDLSGCRDAMLAGFVYGIMREHSMKESLVYGQGAFYLNSQSSVSVNRDMTYSALKDAVDKIKSKIDIEESVI